MLNKRIPAYMGVLTFMTGAMIGVLTMAHGERKGDPRAATRPARSPEKAEPARTGHDAPYLLKRRGGYRFTRPLVYGEPVRPAERMAPLADTLQRIIDRHRRNGDLQSASVYVREFSKGEWTEVNGGETYDPGSVLKIPVLMYYLQREHERPGTLEERVVAPPTSDRGPKPRFEGPHTVPGQVYTVRQLLELMIVHSDNQATAILNSGLDPGRFQAIFTELGLPLPDMNAHRYPLSCKDLSVFLKTLYNSTYLEPAVSDQALELMTRSSWSFGLRQGVPKETPVAHKFGESGQPGAYQLHEAGIVYLPGNHYLITVMTRGARDAGLERTIAELSAATHAWLAAEASRAS